MNPILPEPLLQNKKKRMNPILSEPLLQNKKKRVFKRAIVAEQEEKSLQAKICLLHRLFSFYLSCRAPTSCLKNNELVAQRVDRVFISREERKPYYPGPLHMNPIFPEPMLQNKKKRVFKRSALIFFASFENRNIESKETRLIQITRCKVFIERDRVFISREKAKSILSYVENKKNVLVAQQVLWARIVPLHEEGEFMQQSFEVKSKSNVQNNEMLERIRW
ncbi:hypothetical protein Syun_010219 [Stephania yunnanensis]|uniref:Uncharacterized protein n=1 Tax=Stephania yunnanensis TaxID=152371 RepID=A0AAP0KH32_9MAGN